MDLDACQKCQRPRQPETVPSETRSPADELPPTNDLDPRKAAWALIVFTLLGFPCGLIFLPFMIPVLIRLFAYSRQMRPTESGFATFLAWWTAVSVATWIGLIFSLSMVAVCSSVLTLGLITKWQAAALMIGVGACVLGGLAGIAATLAYVQWVFRPTRRLVGVVLRDSLEFALRSKFGDPGASFATEIAGHPETRLQAILAAVNAARNLDDLRRLSEPSA